MAMARDSCPQICLRLHLHSHGLGFVSTNSSPWPDMASDSSPRIHPHCPLRAASSLGYYCFMATDSSPWPRIHLHNEMAIRFISTNSSPWPDMAFDLSPRIRLHGFVFTDSPWPRIHLQNGMAISFNSIGSSNIL